MKDYHVRGTVVNEKRETFVCGVAALSKLNAAGYVIDRLYDDGYSDVQVGTVTTLPGKSTLCYGRPILYRSY